MAAPPSVVNELYRSSGIGASLMDTIDDLINEGHIEPQLAIRILGHFDTIAQEVIADKVNAKLNFKGHLDTYRFCDEVWTFLLKDIKFTLDGTKTELHSDKLKIVSMAAKKADEK